MFDGMNEHKDTNSPASSKTVDAASSEDKALLFTQHYGTAGRLEKYLGISNEHNPDGDC